MHGGQQPSRPLAEVKRVSSPQRTVTETVTPLSASQNAGSSVMVFGVLLVSVAVLYFGRDVFVPFAIATLLSFMLAPLVIRLRRLGAPRVISIILVVALAFSVIAGLGIVVTNQIASLADDIPRYERNIEAKVKSLQDLLP
jgi:predicted PurR-regulated permease PerM